MSDKTVSCFGIGMKSNEIEWNGRAGKDSELTVWLFRWLVGCGIWCNMNRSPSSPITSRNHKHWAVVALGHREYEKFNWLYISLCSNKLTYSHFRYSFCLFKLSMKMILNFMDFMLTKLKRTKQFLNWTAYTVLHALHICICIIGKHISFIRI